MSFTPPAANESDKWTAISELLRAEVSTVYSEDDGAKAIDDLHRAMVKTLCSLGYERTTAAKDTKHDRPPLGNARSAAAKEVQRCRKEARQGATPWATVWSNIKVKGCLNQAGEEEDRARKIRLNHKLAQANPKRIADMIWGRAMGSEPPECTTEECERFFRDVFAPIETPATMPSWLPPQRAPLALPPLVITTAMVERLLRNKARTASAPGVDGITYSMWASIPWICSQLAVLFNKLVMQQTCPSIWKFGWTVLLHKGGPRTLPNFRPITLTPTLAKLFHAIVAAWLEKGVIASGIIKTDLQKGFLTGISGAIEHDLVLDETLWQAKHGHKNINMVLVDLKNAFGSVPHHRISWALKRYGAPNWTTAYVQSLYSGTFTKMACKTFTTSYLPLERGVLQGDTLSPLLFLLVMQVGLDALHQACPSYGYRAGDQKHFLKCFADDLTVITQDASKLQLSIGKLEEIMEWLGMELKPSKCRAFALSNGKYRRINIKVYGETILNVEDAPTKFLGMELTTNQTFLQKAVVAEQGVSKIVSQLDQFLLPKQDKVKLFKNFAIPKMRWILMVQDILPTALSRINCRVEGSLKKWWSLPRSTSRDALRLALGMPSIVDLAEQGQLLKHHISQSSHDPAVRAVWTSRKTRNHKTIRNLVTTFGPVLPACRTAAKRTLAHQQSRNLIGVVAKLRVQGQWSLLGIPEEERRRWRTMIWGLPTSVAQYATKSALDLLPTKANLSRWHVVMDSSCPRCGVKETLHHVLNNCPHLLNSGAYKWRHNSVLQHLHSEIVKANKWKTVCVDLPGRDYSLPFAPDASWRPDLVLQDDNNRIHFVELTIPFETNLAAAHQRKEAKYQRLVENAKDAGLLPTLSCIEMGSRGIQSKAWATWITQQRLKVATTKICAQISVRASMVVWGNRHAHWPDPPLLEALAGEW